MIFWMRFANCPSSLRIPPSTPECGVIRGRKPVALPLCRRFFDQTSAVAAFCRFTTFCGGTGMTHRCRPWHVTCVLHVSQHANFWCQICSESFLVNTKPDGHFHKQAVQAYKFVWKKLAAIISHSNLSQVPGMFGTRSASGPDSRYLYVCSSAQVAGPSKMGCDSGLCSGSETCAGA